MYVSLMAIINVQFSIVSSSGLIIRKLDEGGGIILPLIGISVVEACFYFTRFIK